MSRRSTQLQLFVLAVAGLCVLATSAALAIGLRGQADLAAGPSEEQWTLVLDREALATVDLELVHTELVPNWVVARGGIKAMHWDRLMREAGGDPNLKALLDAMAERFEADPMAAAAELRGLVQAWNDYLAKAGKPWRLAGEVVTGSSGGSFRLKSYWELLSDGRVRVGAHEHVARVRRRVDQTNQVDVWLGHVHSHEEGVVLLLDRLTGFALDRVWPMLDPALDSSLDPLQARFAPAIRAEASRALTAEHMVALHATASDRWWLMRAADAVHARHRCGSQFVVARMPWNGLSSRDLATLRRHALASTDRDCPEVTLEESLVFAARSQHIKQQRDAHDALEALVAWVAGAVAVHEARHAADVAALGGSAPRCPGCPTGTSALSVLEGSAYLASFGHEGSAALSMFQACGLHPETVPERASIIRFLADRLQDGGCLASPAEDLAERAAVLEQALFGRSEPIELVDFPAALPVSTEYAVP